MREGGRIVDFKTTARSPDSDLAAHLNEIQLSCYAVLYREATGHHESGMELHHLVKTKQPKLVITTLKPTAHNGSTANAPAGMVVTPSQVKVTAAF